MLTVPGIALRDAGKATTEVLCPRGCGETVLRLGPGEAVETRTVALTKTRAEEGECQKCKAVYRVVVGEQ